MRDEPSSMASAKFTAPFPQLDVPFVRVPWSDEFPSVTLETKEGDALQIGVNCAPSPDPEKTLAEARSIGERIVRELAFTVRRFIGPLALEKVSGCLEGVVPPRAGIRFGGSAESRWGISDSAAERIVRKARDAQDMQRECDLELFRSALGVSDPGARLVLLYATLQHVLGFEYQDEVDEWVWKQAPETPRHVRPRRPRSSKRVSNHEVTSYTAARDSLGHVGDQQTTFEDALKHARELSGSLEGLVVEAIVQHCGC